MKFNLLSLVVTLHLIGLATSEASYTTQFNTGYNQGAISQAGNKWYSENSSNFKCRELCNSV